MADLKPYLQIIASGRALGASDAAAAFDVIMGGEATPAQIGALIMGLRARGETVEEIAGAARTVRARMLAVEAPPDAMDIVGTGGDHSGTYNISTATAFVVAGAGVPVAKHGNRAISSKSGAGDVLAALGVKLDVSPATISRAIGQAGVGFMFAPAHHASFRHVGPVRAEIGTKTIFNLLGPLSNPASVKHILLGVYDAGWVEPIARVLQDLGTVSAMVVHGLDGSDELTVAAASRVAQLRDGQIRVFEVTPEMAGLERCQPGALAGGDATHNAAALRRVLAGDPGAYRDAVLLNAAAALMIAGKADNLRQGAALAAAAIASGRAAAALDTLIAVSNAG